MALGQWYNVGKVTVSDTKDVPEQMSLKDVIQAQVRTMPFEAVKDLLAEEKVDVDRLEVQVREASAGV
jgi:hypothetical protein